MQEQKYVPIWKKIVFNNQYVWDEQFKVVKLVLRYIFTNMHLCFKLWCGFINIWQVLQNFNQTFCYLRLHKWSGGSPFYSEVLQIIVTFIAKSCFIT